MRQLFHMFREVRDEVIGALRPYKSPRQAVLALRRSVRRFARRRGVDLQPFNAVVHSDARRRFLLDLHRIDEVVDVGANEGQFAQSVRHLGYRGHITSYEPLKAAGKVLEHKARGDARWTIKHKAVGDGSQVVILHVAGNSASSSLHGMLPAHSDAAPDAAYIGHEEVLQVRLDDQDIPGERLFLKLDTQGSEMAVLRGAMQLLKRVCILQFESSLVPLYEGEALFAELHAWVTERGFVLAAIENGFVDPRTGRLLQIDVLYIRDPQ